MAEQGKSEAQQFYENFVPADAMSWSAGSQGWVEACAKDYWAERAQYGHHTQPAPVSRQQTRHDWYARQDWQRTVRAIARPRHSRHEAAWYDSRTYGAAEDSFGLWDFISAFLPWNW